MSDFRNLEVWKKAHAFVLSIYATTRSFPREEQYALTDQIRRAAVSVPTNIVAGNQRQGSRQFRQFLGNADGSLAESKYLLLLSRDLGYPPETQFDLLEKAAEEIGRMIGGLMRAL